MAQIALRKTAEQAKDLYPEAAQILKNNTYMDDICDSVRSAQEAMRLTTELDLSNRGLFPCLHSLSFT